MYNSASLLEAIKIVAILIINDCLPSQIKYPAKCDIFLAQVGLAFLSKGNTWSIELATDSARQIIN